MDDAQVTDEFRVTWRTVLCDLLATIAFALMAVSVAMSAGYL